MIVKIFAALFILLTVSCTNPRTLYISNKTDKAVTLLVERDTNVGAASQNVSFVDSLNGKRIVQGHTIINFGKGTWNDADQENLKTILSRIKMLQDGNTAHFSLPQNTKIKHIGWFVNELVFRINEPK